MNLKEQMQFAGEHYGDTPVFEMAQQHFDNQIVDLIKDGEFEKAAEKYIDNHGTTKPPQKATATTSKLKRGDFAKSLKADPSKVEGINKEEWASFEQAYSELMGTAEQEKRGYKKTKGTVDAATGKVKTSAQSGSARVAALEKLEAKIQKIAGEHQKAIEASDDEEEKEELKDKLRGLEILGQALQNTKAGRATIPPQTEKEYERLAARYEKIGGNLLDKIKGLASIQGPAEMPDTEGQEREAAVKSLKKRMAADRGLKMIDSIEDEIEDFRMRKEMKGQARSEVLPPKMEESMKVAGAILAESLEYQGTDFWTNYIGSNIVRVFNEDVKKYGAKNARDMYCYAFGGKEVAPLFNYMIENTEMLNEAAEVEGTFLFETMGLRNVKNYLTEAPSVLDAGGAGRRAAARAFEYTPVSELVGKGGKAMAAASGASKAAKGAAGSAGLMGWLGGLWDKLKAFGKPLVKKLGGFISQGAKWAKEIAQKGMEFLHTNPIARVAVPAVALAGTIGGGIALINKIRKRAGKGKLSKSEEKKLRAVAEKNEGKLESKYGAKVA